MSPIQRGEVVYLDRGLSIDPRVAIVLDPPVLPGTHAVVAALFFGEWTIVEATEGQLYRESPPATGSGI